MPESQEFKSVRTHTGDESTRDNLAGDRAVGAENRMTAALDRLETALERTLADYAALKHDHRELQQNYHALRDRTESVGEQLDATIGRLKDIMDGGMPAGNMMEADINTVAEDTEGKSEWVKSPSE